MMRRAVDEADKQARRASILEAARRLFEQGDGRLPTTADVAEACGVAKGTVYLYFQTKEEIFANVLLEGWLPVLAAAETAFAKRKAPPLKQARVFVAAAVDHLGRHPELLRLDALSAGVLEKNMAPGALREYKRRFDEGLLDAGNRIDHALRLKPGRGVHILVRTYALTRGLWQTEQHSEALAAAGIRPALERRAGGFSDELLEALMEYWRGALL